MLLLLLGNTGTNHILIFYLKCVIKLKDQHMLLYMNCSLLLTQNIRFSKKMFQENIPASCTELGWKVFPPQFKSLRPW